MSKSNSSHLALISTAKAAKAAKGSIAQSTGAVASRSVPLVAAATVVGDLVTSVQKWGTVREQERTRRAQIAAGERVAVQRIQSQERLVNKTIDGELGKQQVAMKAGVDLLHHAMAHGNDAQLELAVSLLLETVRQDPLRSIRHFAQDS